MHPEKEIFPFHLSYWVIAIVVQLPSHVQLFVTPGTAAHQASLSLTISRSLPKFMFIASVMPSSHIILWRPLLLLPSIFPGTRDFSNESSIHIRWPKYWSFSFSISPSSEYLGLISLKIDWFVLLSVQGNFRSLLQQQSSKASFLCFLSSLWSSSHNCMWPLGRPYPWLYRLFSHSSVSAFQHTV